MATFDPGETSPVVRALFAIRWTIGRVLGLDRDETGLGARVPSLRDRLPADLADTPTDFDAHLFTPLYVTDDEFALEIANQTDARRDCTSAGCQTERAVIAARWPSW